MHVRPKYIEDTGGKYLAYVNQFPPGMHYSISKIYSAQKKLAVASAVFWGATYLTKKENVAAISRCCSCPEKCNSGGRGLC
jgi:hypothetical protein